MSDIVRVGIGLALLIAANITLGSTGAILSGDFDLQRFRTGIVKGLLVALSLVAIYWAGNLNPDLLVLDTGASTLNLLDAVYVLMIAAFVHYGYDIIQKLKCVLMPSESPIEGTPEGVPEGVPEEPGASAELAGDPDIFAPPKKEDNHV